jgi:D-threo-aldose 1-dehydrogenase
MIKLFLERFDIDYFLVAMPYTLLDQEALDEDFALCAERNAKVVIGAVFASGILATGTVDNASYAYQEASPDILERVRNIDLVCAEFDVPLHAATIQFPLAHDLVESVIPGANSPLQVRQNIASLTRPIPDAFWTVLRGRGLIRAMHLSQCR